MRLFSLFFGLTLYLCKLFNYEGRALKDTFDIVCNNWLDEGMRDERNFSIDHAAKEPLVYLYEVVSKSNTSGRTIETNTEIYRGGGILICFGIIYRFFLLYQKLQKGDHETMMKYSIKEICVYISLTIISEFCFLHLVNT